MEEIETKVENQRHRRNVGLVALFNSRAAVPSILLAAPRTPLLLPSGWVDLCIENGLLLLRPLEIWDAVCKLEPTVGDF